MNAVSRWLINTAIRFVIEHKEKLHLVELEDLYKAEHAIIEVVEDKIHEERKRRADTRCNKL